MTRPFCPAVLLVVLLGSSMLPACGQDEDQRAPVEPPGDQGGLDQAAAMPDLGGPLDASGGDAGVTMPDGMNAQDVSPPPTPDGGVGEGDMGTKAPELPRIDPGMYKGIDPLTTLGKPQVVGAKELRGFVHHMSWRHDLQVLEMAYARGERKVNTPESPLYKDEGGENRWVVHPWSTRHLQKDESVSLVHQYHARTRQGRNWCIYLSDQAEPKTVCHHHQQKQGSSLRWWQGGDGLTTVFDWPTLPSHASYPGDPDKKVRLQQDAGGVHALGRADGTTYVSLMSGRSRSWVVRVPPDPEAGPTVEAEGVAPKEGAMDPQQPYPFQFMAWSVNEDALYFSTIGDGSEKVGRVWYALVNQDGSLKSPKPFTQDAFPQPWGLAFDAVGHLYVASKFHVRIYDDQGAFLGAVEVVDPETQAKKNAPTVSALAFGGPEGLDLYVSLGPSTVGSFGSVNWPDGGGEYTQGQLLRLSSKIPGAWRRRLDKEGR